MFGFGFGRKRSILNKNDKTFLFDEGFGTQDPESVAVVLKRCFYKENRIVGIISHVAELQERIPVPSMCLKTKKRKFGKRKLN
jgi:exonuclease SbcC